MVRVTITECYGERREHVSSHKSADEAGRLAVAQAYGRGRFLCVDNGLTVRGSSVRYGQIGHYMDRRRGLISTDTGRVRIEFEGE